MKKNGCEKVFECAYPTKECEHVNIGARGECFYKTLGGKCRNAKVLDDASREERAMQPSIEWTSDEPLIEKRAFHFKDNFDKGLVVSRNSEFYVFLYTGLSAKFDKWHKNFQRSVEPIEVPE